MATAEQPDFQTIRWRFDETTGIGTVVLDRPDALNAMSKQTLSELPEAFDCFEAIDKEGDSVSVRAIVIEGAGERAFSTGVDVTEIGDESYPYVADSFRTALFTVRDYPAPVVAKIDGYCLGGGIELALLCDFRIASDRSELGFPEVDLGIFPSGVGTTQRLPRLVGSNRAKELMMTGEFISGATAATDGLITSSHPADELDEAVDALVSRLAEKPPLALRAIKDTVDAAHDMPLSQGTEYEYQAYQPLLHTEDYEEGAAAFAEDRDPVWQGK